MAREVARDGEADALVAAGLAEDRGVDADQLAARVDQRAAGVARVDRGVGLDEVLVGGEPAFEAAAESR